MKILFLVGSLEEKKNGVADYVLNLTDGLEKLGHKIAIISINDYQYITTQKDGLENRNNSRIRISSDNTIVRKKKYHQSVYSNF